MQARSSPTATYIVNLQQSVNNAVIQTDGGFIDRVFPSFCEIRRTDLMESDVNRLVLVWLIKNLKFIDGNFFIFLIFVLARCLRCYASRDLIMGQLHSQSLKSLFGQSQKLIIVRSLLHCINVVHRVVMVKQQMYSFNWLLIFKLISTKNLHST